MSGSFAPERDLDPFGVLPPSSNLGSMAVFGCDCVCVLSSLVSHWLEKSLFGVEIGERHQVLRKVVRFPDTPWHYPPWQWNILYIDPAGCTEIYVTQVECLESGNLFATIMSKY